MSQYIAIDEARAAGCTSIELDVIEHRNAGTGWRTIARDMNRSMSTIRETWDRAYRRTCRPNLDPRHPPAEVRFAVFRRDGYRCQICGRDASDGAKLEIDHKIAYVKTGDSAMSNLWTLCGDCNAGKAALDL